MTAASCALILFNSQSGGPSAGLTSSPGDNGATCTNCHRGTATPTSGLITSNIPSSGYVPGQTYEVTFTITEMGLSKFGFQMTAEDASNANKGTFAATPATRIMNSGAYIGHNASGNSGSGSKAWKVNWTAPAAGTGDITFYGAGNAANGDGGTGGDIIRTSSLMVTEDAGATSIQPIVEDQISIFPNPAENEIFISGVEGEYTIFDLSGSVRAQGDNTGNAIDISNLEKGVYFISLAESNDIVRIVKR